MTHHSICQTPAEHAAIAATHAALMAVNSVEEWAPQTHLFGDLEHVLVAMLRDTYPGADVDASAWLTDLHDGATPADAETLMRARHGIGVQTSADRQHWIETGEQTRHVVEIDATWEGEPDEGFAAFCSCGWRCDWIHTDTEPDSLDAAAHEGGLHLESVGLPYAADMRVTSH